MSLRELRAFAAAVRTFSIDLKRGTWIEGWRTEDHYDEINRTMRAAQVVVRELLAIQIPAINKGKPSRTLPEIKREVNLRVEILKITLLFFAIVQKGRQLICSQGSPEIALKLRKKIQRIEAVQSDNLDRMRSLLNHTRDLCAANREIVAQVEALAPSSLCAIQ